MSDGAFDRLGFAVNLELLPGSVDESVGFVEHLEELGFDSVWIPDSKLANESISVLGALTRTTDRIDLCSGVAIHWTRNVALMAQTWSTLYELAGPRLRCGLGAWWDPLARKVGIDRERPLRAMWEYCTVLDRLLDFETVTYDGEVIQVEDVRLDPIGSSATPRDIPLYVGATGLTMNTMTGELIGEGVVAGSLLNAFVPVEYTAECVENLAEGARKRGADLAAVDRPQYIAVSMADEADAAIEALRGTCAKYLALEPHFAAACGEEDLAAAIREEAGGSSAGPEALKAASHLVPDDVVRDMAVAGTPEQCVAGVQEYCEAGCTEPVLYPVTDNVREMADVFAGHA